MLFNGNFYSIIYFVCYPQQTEDKQNKSTHGPQIFIPSMCHENKKKKKEELNKF